MTTAVMELGVGGLTGFLSLLTLQLFESCTEHERSSTIQ